MKNVAPMFIMLAAICGCNPEKNGEAKIAAENLEPILQHCVGRTLIGLPSSFNASIVTTGIFKFKNHGGQEEPIDVLVRELKDTSSFAFEIQKRQAELAESSSPAMDVLREIKAVDNNATLFRVQRIEDAYVSELVFLRDGLITQRKRIRCNKDEPSARYIMASDTSRRCS